MNFHDDEATVTGSLEEGVTNLHDHERGVIGIVDQGIMNNLHQDESKAIARVEGASIMTFTNDCTSPEPSKRLKHTESTYWICFSGIF